MARIYAHKKGKAGSTRPVRTTAPSWIRYTPEEVAKIVLKLQKEGMPPSKIGLVLRDTYGLPSTRLAAGKKIGQILKENSAASEYPEDLFNLMRRAVRIRKHLVNFDADLHSLRGLSNTEMKILRLVRYYKKTGVLPADWKYDPAQAAIIVSGR